jgi:hypothetical protein
MRPFLVCVDPESDASSPGANLRLALLRVNHGADTRRHTTIITKSRSRVGGEPELVPC